MAKKPEKPNVETMRQEAVRAFIHLMLSTAYNEETIRQAIVISNTMTIPTTTLIPELRELGLTDSLVASIWITTITYTSFILASVDKASRKDVADALIVQIGALQGILDDLPDPTDTSH